MTAYHADQIDVSLVGHSSIIVRTPQQMILCDPWLFGYAFNDGWKIYPEPDLSKIDFSKITHIWISHEHPDHFHFPSLKKISKLVDPSKVEILFQDTNSEKVFDAMRGMGFTKMRRMEHMRPIAIDESLSLFVYAHRQLDSALGVLVNGKPVLLNINDTELSDGDIKILKRRFGRFPVLFNQFSIAGFDGNYEGDDLLQGRKKVLEKVVHHHKSFEADVTVPFASFMYFCKDDNWDLNQFGNSIVEAKAFLEQNGCACGVLRTNSEFVPLDRLASCNDLAFYVDYSTSNPREREGVKTVSFEECNTAFHERTTRWKSNTVGGLYSKLKSVTAFIPDMDMAVVMNFQECRLEVIDLPLSDCDLVVNSQPLQQAFALPFGIQTLGVSGRYRFNRRVPSWKLVRIISSLANAEIYLNVQSIFAPRTLRWVWARRNGLVGQIRQQVKRFAT